MDDNFTFTTPMVPHGFSESDFTDFQNLVGGH